MSSKRKATGLVLFPNAKKSRQMSLIPARPRIRTAKSGGFEGLRNGVAVSGSDRPELKNYDVNVSATSVVSGTPYVGSLLSGIAEGTSDSQRIGQKIVVKSVDIELNVTLSLNGATVGSPSAFMDYFVIWDKQPNAAQATAANIFATTTTNLTFMNTQNTERFVVLRRHRVCLDEAQGMGEIFHVHVPLDLATKFPDSNTFPTTNDLLICALSPNTVAAGSYTPNIAYVARMKYSDV